MGSPADASAEEVLAQVSPGDIARTLPPLNLLATLQVQPGEDEDNAPKGPEMPQQRRITSWIMQQVLSDTPQAPTPRLGHMVQLHQAQSISLQVVCSAPNLSNLPDLRKMTHVSDEGGVSINYTRWKAFQHILHCNLKI